MPIKSGAHEWSAARHKTPPLGGAPLGDLLTFSSVGGSHHWCSRSGRSVRRGLKPDGFSNSCRTGSRSPRGNIQREAVPAFWPSGVRSGSTLRERA